MTTKEQVLKAAINYIHCLNRQEALEYDGKEREEEAHEAEATTGLALEVLRATVNDYDLE